MTMKINPEDHDWLTAPETQHVMAALGDARFVGGCVRNSLLQQPISDIDIATPLLPEEVIERLALAGMRYAPTGIDHGTITAIVGNETFEITTLRRDVTTDGRRATVAFTGEWLEDAQRRDFTMNAIYMEADGTIYDPVGGVGDLRRRQVRFIGDARARLQEDFLRALRFFRFHTFYGEGAFDGVALAAIYSLRAGLQSLSGERIQSEVLKLLSAPEPVDAVMSMDKVGIWDEIIGEPINLARFEHLVQIERDHHFESDALLRLTALTLKSTEVATEWRFSNAMKARMKDARLNIPASTHNAKRMLYQHGKEAFIDSVKLAWAAEDDENRVFWMSMLSLAANWEIPKFPITGKKILAAGVKPGPAVGRMLAKLEMQWIEAEFPEEFDTYLMAAITEAHE